jgi:hypothetical protein
VGISKIKKRGKKFQKIVLNHFKENETNFNVIAEKHISFEEMSSIKNFRGRIDLLILEDDSDFLVIYELKATDWDKIKITNIKRNVYRHQKQLF